MDTQNLDYAKNFTFVVIVGTTPESIGNTAFCNVSMVNQKRFSNENTSAKGDAC